MPVNNLSFSAAKCILNKSKNDIYLFGNQMIQAAIFTVWTLKGYLSSTLLTSVIAKLRWWTFDIQIQQTAIYAVTIQRIYVLSNYNEV